MKGNFPRTTGQNSYSFILIGIGRISSNICAPHDRFASFEANPFNSAESDGNTLDQSRTKTLPRKAFDLDDESELRK
jgi:hypothetical protein